jgi:hypothetical protein
MLGSDLRRLLRFRSAPAEPTPAAAVEAEDPGSPIRDPFVDAASDHANRSQNLRQATSPRRQTVTFSGVQRKPHEDTTVAAATTSSGPDHSSLCPDPAIVMSSSPKISPTFDPGVDIAS